MKVSSITVDGSLQDWSNIAEISIADASGRAAGLDNTAKVRLAWNDTYLYAAYNVTDTELLAVQTTRDHGDIYKDDEIELYVDPQGDGGSASSMTTTDYQFLANIRGALGDQRGNGSGGKDASYNAASFLAQVAANGTVNASGTDVGYVIELRIAWSDLGVTPAAGDAMRLDVAVGDRDGTAQPPVQSFDWAGLTLYNNPSGWQEVRLVDPPPPAEYDIAKVPSMAIDGDLDDWAGISAIDIADDPANGRGGLNNSARVRLAWNTTYLYAAYDVTDTELLAVQTTRDAADIFKDDEVELYIDPQGDGGSATSMTTTDYQFLANIREAMGDRRGDGSGGKDASYNAASFLAQVAPNGTVNAAGADVGYTVELRIAWSDLGVTPAAGRFMRMDLAVGDRDGSGPPPVHSFDWAGLTLYDNPSGWKGVRLGSDGTPPAAPTNLALIVVSSTRIDVSWTASSSTDVARYNIYRGTTASPTLLTSAAASPFQNTGLTAGTTYTYQVSAVDAAGNESARTPAQSATTTGATPSNGLRIGVFSNREVGSGPGNDATGEQWGALMYGPSPSTIASDIDRADDDDVLLLLTMAGNKPAYTDGSGNFSMSLYRQQLNRFVADSPNAQVNQATSDKIADAMARRRIVCYIVDEPNLENATNPLIKPAEVAQMAVEHKNRWNCLTLARVTPTFLANGWKGHPKPANGYPKLDYAWSQYNPVTAADAMTPAEVWADERAVIASAGLNMGLAISLNIWAGGIVFDTDDREPCWDYANNGSSSGYVLGTREGANQGEPRNCGTLGSPPPSVIASPDWIRHFVQRAAADGGFPFVLLWNHATGTSTHNDYNSYYTRSDFVNAFDDAIQTGQGAQAAPWRAPK